MVQKGKRPRVCDGSPRSCDPRSVGCVKQAATQCPRQGHRCEKGRAGPLRQPASPEGLGTLTGLSLRRGQRKDTRGICRTRASAVVTQGEVSDTERDPVCAARAALSSLRCPEPVTHSQRDFAGVTLAAALGHSHHTPPQRRGASPAGTGSRRCGSARGAWLAPLALQTDAGLSQWPPEAGRTGTECPPEEPTGTPSAR